MVGGSAPSQTSGAPYRTQTGNRTSPWPSQAHQSGLCNRGFGVYSFFPGPGDTPKTLYTPTAKGSHPGNFPGFGGTEKVSEAIFSNKFSVVQNGTSQFDPNIKPEVSGEEISLTRASKFYSQIETKFDEKSVRNEKESTSKRLLKDVVIIQYEEEGRSKICGKNTDTILGKNEKQKESINKSREPKDGMPIIKDESASVRVGDVLANEPDSTEFKISSKTRTNEGFMTLEVETSEKASVTSGNEADLFISVPVDGLEKNEVIEIGINKEKCNIKLISENEGENPKQLETLSVRIESVNDICNRLTEKKYAKAKTPDSNCKNLLAGNRKLYHEAPKPSPTRTLTLSPQNGGCSRTTPVTFKHTSLQEADSKSQSMHIEVPSLFIKKEPLDFHKNPSSTPFLSPPHLDNNFLSPDSLNVLDGQLLSPTPYSSGFESSNRQKESFFSPLDQSFLSPNQAFLSPRSAAGSPFLNPDIDIARFGGYKNYPTLPKLGDGNYLMNGNNEKILESVFLKGPGCVPLKEIKQPDARIFMSSSTADTELNKISSTVASAGSNVTPCQVAEVTSASSLLNPNHPNVNPSVVKQEATIAVSSSGSTISTISVDQNKEIAFLTSGQSTLVSSTVGASSTRQRCQQRLNEIEMRSNTLPSPPIVHRSVQSQIDIPPAMGTNVFAGGMMNDRSANLVTTWPAPTHNPTLWQYSAPIDYPPFPPVGFQLVRDPVTGHFLLIPASNLEALQRAILWPSYQTSPPQMIIPPLSVQPSSPHLLLDTNVPAVDFLTSETIHHNAASQHRILIASDSSKRKATNPTVIKLEASDCSNALVVTTSDNNNLCSKTQPSILSPKIEPVFRSQRNTSSIGNGRRSQATSPCLTPVPEGLSNQSDPRDNDSCQPQRTVTLQDASNQTDLPFEKDGEKSTTAIVSKDKFLPYTKITEQNIKMTKTQDVGTETISDGEPEDDKRTVLKEIQKKGDIKESLSVSCDNVPDSINIKKEIVSPSQVDLSGLELLSNSIEQFVCDTKCKNNETEGDEDGKDLSNDACEGAVLLQNLKNGFRETKQNKSYKNEASDNLGGLGLLCALAEQRFQEEIVNEINSADSGDVVDQEITCKTKEEENDKITDDLEGCIEQKAVKCDIENSYKTDNDDLPKLRKEVETINDENKITKINKNLSSEEQCKQERDDFENKPSEPERLIAKRGPGRPRKHRNAETNQVLRSFFSPNRDSKEMSPPVLEKQTDFTYGEKDDLQISMSMNSKEDIPPTLIPSTILDPVIKTMAGTLELTPCEVNLIAFKINNDKLKKSDKVEGMLCQNESKKRKLNEGADSYSSSKKRKVGRPRKHAVLNENSTTETIVAKKPKTKLYLFQPTQTVENSNSLKTKNNEDVALENNEKSKSSCTTLDTSAMNDSEDEEKRSKKIKPKLKAEAKLKERTDEQDEKSDRRKNMKKENNFKYKIQTQKKVSIEEKKLNEGSRINGTKEFSLPNCVLKTEDLKSDKFPIRTLTAMGGLFYAGQLSAIRAPDVYGITIDGERGNRPHIYSREEILKDSILEVKPEKASDLLPGTRCCAYWSEQYRCLYPGTVSAPASPDPELDEKFINVEFDDGDSGRINIDDIRLLPKDYPIVEYDPNPLQSLCKRKRRISGASVESHSKEKKSMDFSPSGENNVKESSKSEEIESETPVEEYEPESFLSVESERRHLKKKRRDKLKRLQSLSIDGKKKHKKHKCSDEHRHHRHHKKHRKHKHKHGKRHGGEISGEAIREEEKMKETLNKGSEEIRAKKTCKSKCKSVENSCKLSDKSKVIKAKKCKERTESVESRSKIAAFLPARQLWGWSGKGYRRPGAKGRARKEFYKTIQRGKERITVGDCAVFLSTGRPDRPYIGRIESMWESWGTNMIVRVKWFYHPEETVGCPATLEYPGALFESPHVDENDVQTISHKCEVLPLKEYIAKIGNEPHRFETIYDNNDIYYLAGYYDPTNTNLKMEPGVK